MEETVKNTPKKETHIGRTILKVVVYTLLTIGALIMILPFYWMVISSLKSEPEFRQSIPTFFPEYFSWKNYSYVMDYNSGAFVTSLCNTLIVGLLSTGLGVILTIITAYAFAKMEFKGKDLLFTILLGTMMIPGELYTTTNYVTVGKAGFGWNNTYVVLIVPFLISIYYIFLLRNNFKQIPDSLYKAAKVDGTSDLGFLIKVMVPLTAPTLISITLLKFIGSWNSYIWPQLVNQSYDWRLISSWMQSTFVDREGVLTSAEALAKGELWAYSDGMSSLKMTAACIVSAPLFVLFAFFRKYIMRGVSRSGTKG